MILFLFFSFLFFGLPSLLRSWGTTMPYDFHVSPLTRPYRPDCLFIDFRIIRSF